MSPNWENTIDRVTDPIKLHQYRYNGNDPINSRFEKSVPSSQLSWFKMIGYDLKSMIPQLNEDIWKVPAPWGRSSDFASKNINRVPATVESGFLSHLSERRLSDYEKLGAPSKSALKSDSLVIGPFKIGAASDPPFGKGIVVSRSMNGEAIVSSVPAANAIYRDVYTSVFNRTKLLPFTLVIHNSQQDAFYFVKEETWRSSEDRQQLKRLQGQVNTTFHEPQKDNSEGSKYLDVKIHGIHAVINLRYGTTVEKEKLRMLHHAKTTAIRKAWAREKELLRSGLLTTLDWSQPEIDDILKQGQLNTYETEYINDVSVYPELAEDPYNIRFIKKKTKRRRRDIDLDENENVSNLIIQDNENLS